MRRKLVVGNWKMNGDLVRNRELLRALSPRVPDEVDCAVCVPFPYLAQARELLSGASIGLGAQDVCEFAEGAYTGEVSAAMLADFGCRYAIVGHSERRSMFGDDSALVGRKALAAMRAGLVPILCIGESLEERSSGGTEAVLRGQLDAVAEIVGASALSELVIAYEPVWAIGTGQAASPAQVQRVLSFVRGWLADRTSGADDVRILYGGSVKPESAGPLFGLPDSDGGLIGAASLIAAQFLGICEAARVASRDNMRQFEGLK